jgi:hypothetical protein
MHSSIIRGETTDSYNVEVAMSRNLLRQYEP